MDELSKHYTAIGLLRYTFSMMAMMLVSSVYGIVDGLFVSNAAGNPARVIKALG